MKPKENLSKATGTRNPNRLKGLPKLENIESHFNRNFLEIRTLSNILDNLNPEAKEEIRRAQLVFLMSALDSYMHEIVAYGYIMMFYGYWRQTEAYRRQNVLLSDLESVADKTADRESSRVVTVIRDAVTRGIRYDTLMRYKAICESLENLGIENVSNALFSFESVLNAAVRARDNIVHQTGRKYPGEPNKMPFTQSTAEEYIMTISALQKSIHSMVTIHEKEETDASQASPC